MIKGQKVLGPNGLIPRIVKGLIIADEIRMSANLSTSSINEIKSSYSGSGGIRIGPWGFGGSAGGTKYDITTTAGGGSFGLSTNYTTPVILAVVIEDTIAVDKP
jgi:hypothetical protein